MEMGLLLLPVMVFMPMAGSILSFLTGRQSKQKRDRVVCAVTILEFILALLSFLLLKKEAPAISIPGICGMGLNFQIDGFRAVYITIASFMWMQTSLFSAEYFAHYRNRNRYYLFQLLTLGATVGVFLSADLYTTFIFFEIMSFASYVWVAQDERAASLKAAETYLAVAVIGGLVMLMGVFLLYKEAGTLRIDDLYEACRGKNVYAAAVCMFVGFGAKAGAFPLHIWLPKAHPVAPAPASALLSGILTKTGIYGTLVLSCKIFLHDSAWGTFILLIGVMTMVAGAVLALFSIDFKRTLACSSVSQIGFILVGIGMQGLLGEENALAVRGAFLHMMNHSLFKLTLFMVAGVIYMNLHKLDLNEIRGFGRKKPLLMAVYLSGALGIGGIPLFSGYVSKTLIHESIVEYMEVLEEHAEHAGEVLEHAAEAGHSLINLRVTDIKIIEMLFLFSGGLTVAYMCKLFFAVFIEKNSDPKVQERYDSLCGRYMNRVSSVVLGICAVIFPVIGAFPNVIMDRIADLGQGFMGLEEFEHQVHYFSMTNLKGGLTSILIGVLVYTVVARQWMLEKDPSGTSRYVNRWPSGIDLEEGVYRPLLLKVCVSVFGFFCDICDKMLEVIASTNVVQTCSGLVSDIFDHALEFIAGTEVVQKGTGYVCEVLDASTDFTAKLNPLAADTELSFHDTCDDPVINFMKKNVWNVPKAPDDFEEGNKLTYMIGRILNSIRNVLNLTLLRSDPCEKDFTHRLAMIYEGFKENTSLIARSLSYGLLLFCLGLCGTLVYLLVTMIRMG